MALLLVTLLSLPRSCKHRRRLSNKNDVVLYMRQPREGIKGMSAGSLRLTRGTYGMNTAPPVVPPSQRGHP
eukprot:1633695-Amphidinium_carterae.1